MRTWLAILLACPLLAQDAAKPRALTAVCRDSEILEFGLECSAEEPCPIYLESDRPESVAFYRARGFEILGELRLLELRCWRLGCDAFRLPR